MIPLTVSLLNIFVTKLGDLDEVEVSLPNSTSEQPARVRLLGCTDKSQAIREGKYMAATKPLSQKISNLSNGVRGTNPNLWRFNCDYA